jgi:CheY-like chemotaxis protein
MMSADVILVVEDEPLVRYAMTDNLEEVGFTVHEAANGDEAIKIIDAEPRLDALLTDIRMPGVADGWVVAEHARRRREDIPVIYMTGFSPDRGREVPGSILLQKPATREMVLEALARLGLPAQGLE